MRKRPRRRVVALDRPAQRSFAAVVGGAGDAQHFGRGRRHVLRAGVGRERQERNGYNVVNGMWLQDVLLSLYAASEAAFPGLRPIFSMLKR